VRGSTQAEGLSTWMYLQWMQEWDFITWTHANFFAEQWSSENVGLQLSQRIDEKR